MQEKIIFSEKIPYRAKLQLKAELIDYGHECTIFIYDPDAELTYQKSFKSEKKGMDEFRKLAASVSLILMSREMKGYTV